MPKIDPVAIANSPRTRKWGLRAAIFVVVVGVLGFFVAPPVLKSLVVGKLGEALHREVAIGDIEINPYTLTVQIRDVSVKEKDGKELIGFDSLFVNAEFSSIVHRGIVIKEVSLAGPRVRLVRIDATRYNISDLIEEFAAKPKDDSPPPRFSVGNIQISGGKFEFEDQLEQASHAVTDIALRLPFVSNISYYTEAYVEPHFSAVVNGAPLEINGKSKPFVDSLESELVLDLDNLQLGKYLTYSPVELPIRIPSGGLFGDLHFRFVQTKGQPSTFALDGKLALKDLRVEESGGAPLLAFKQFEVAIREFDFVKNTLGIESVLLEAPAVDVSVSKAGEMNWMKLVPKGSTASDAPPAAKTKSAGPDLVVSVDAVALKDGVVRMRDEASGKDAKGIVEFFKAEEIALKQARVDTGKQKVGLGEFSTRGIAVNVTRLADGKLRFLTPPPGKTDKPVAKPADKAAGAPWSVLLEKVAIERNRVSFEDRTVSPTATQTLELATLSAENISTDPNELMKLAASLRINQKGVLDLAGTLKPLASEGEISIDGHDIELLPIQPYVGDKANVVITRGVVAMKGTAEFKPGKDGAIAGGYKGQLTLGNFHSIDKAHSADLLKWKSFHFGNMDIRANPNSVSIGEIALSDFYARVILGKDGKLNLAKLAKGSGDAAEGEAKPAEKAAEPASAAPAPEKTADAAPAAPEPAKEVLPVKVGKVTLQGGNVNFSDYFVQPNYSANLKKIGGRVSGLSSTEGTVADMELRGSYNDLAPLNITAKLNPLAANRFLDLEADVRGVEMTNFSTYAGKYAGYGIEKGQLSLFLKYKIEDRKLTAENRVFLDQLTFGDPVESAEATKLPVKLAVSLLQNRNGEIDINLPISGSLDDPQFSIGGVIVKVILNLFVKAVTSPVALLGSMFGGGDELAFVEFDYGYATLTDPMRERLKTLVKVLVERPSLKLEIAGRADPERDREGLKRALMERRVKAQKQADLVKKGTETGSVDEIPIDAKEYPAYLTRAYKAEKFPKPRNFIGMVKELPVEEMEKLMIANVNAGDDELRDLAERRAAAAREWIVSEGKVPAERVFTVQPHLTAKDGPQNDKAKESRVDFLLK